MNPKYEKGQQVQIRPASNRVRSPRDSTLQPYIGQIGQISDYYWISPRAGEIFFIYTVRFERGIKEIVLHEDEIRPYRK